MDDSKFEEHFDHTRSKLDMIAKDMECLTEKGGKDMGESFDSGMLAGLLSKQGVDPGILAMLSDKKNSGEWGDGGLLILLFLIILMGGNGFGGWNKNVDGSCGVDRTIFNQSNFENISNAIQTQGTRQEMAINTLAQNLNCSNQMVQNALAGVDKQLALTNGNVINAVQNAQNQIQAQLSECCCRQTAALDRAACGINSNIQESRYNTASQFAAQTALLQSQHCETINTINNGFANLELRDLQRTLDQKNAEINDLKLQVSQTAQTAQIIAAIRNMDSVTFQGTAGSTAFTGSGSIS